MRREVSILILQNPGTYSVTPLHGDVQDIPNICQPPKVFLGISVNHSELKDELSLPILRQSLVGSLADRTDKPAPDDRLIALLQIRRGADCNILRDCTIEQALALCETFDTA